MTADGPSHQQPRTNKRKARSDVSLVLIRRVNLALGLMGGSQRSPLGPPSGSGLRVTQRGPGRAGWGQRAAPSPSVLRFTPSRSPTSSLSHRPWRAASTSPSGTLRSGGGSMGRSAPSPPTSPARGSRCTVDRDWPGLDTGHMLVHTRTRKHTHARPSHCSEGGPSGQGRGTRPAAPYPVPWAQGPRSSSRHWTHPSPPWSRRTRGQPGRPRGARQVCSGCAQATPDHDGP